MIRFQSLFRVVYPWLRGVLRHEHMQYWLLFVKACTLLASRTLRKSDVELADQHLSMFCSCFEAVNGKKCCTPNMHLHLHLKDCIGPLYAFWCYPFERHNGMLGGFPTNLRSIEPQLMKKCLLLQELHSQTIPKEGEVFKSLLEQHVCKPPGGMPAKSVHEWWKHWEDAFIDFLFGQKSKLCCSSRAS